MVKRFGVQIPVKEQAFLNSSSISNYKILVEVQIQNFTFKLKFNIQIKKNILQKLSFFQVKVKGFWAGFHEEDGIIVTASRQSM